MAGGVRRRLRHPDDSSIPNQQALRAMLRKLDCPERLERKMLQAYSITYADVNSKDHEQLPENSETMILLRVIDPMGKRLARREPQ